MKVTISRKNPHIAGTVDEICLRPESAHDNAICKAIANEFDTVGKGQNEGRYHHVRVRLYRQRDGTTPSVATTAILGLSAGLIAALAIVS